MLVGVVSIMGIISGEPNWFILMIMDVLEKLGIVPKPKEMTPDEMKEFIEMMKAKGWHFEEEDKK
jgi:hypothetical protein